MTEKITPELYRLKVQQAEQELLCSIISNAGMISMRQVRDSVEVEDFSTWLHSELYSLVLRMDDLGKEINPNTVAFEVLHSNLNLEHNGAVLWVLDLPKNAGTGASFWYYVHKIKEFALRRKLLHASTVLAALCEQEVPVNEMMEELESNIVSVLAKHGSRHMVDSKGTLDAAVEDIESLTRPEHSVVTTGYLGLNEAMGGGFRPGNVYIIGARPSVGKSALAGNLMLNAGKARKSSLFISLEMPIADLGKRFIAHVADIPYYVLNNGRVTPEQVDRILQSGLDRYPFLIDARPVQTIARISQTVRDLRREHLCDIVFIDYLQLVKADNKKATSYEQVSQISRDIKEMAREHNIPVVALAQLNREVENRGKGRPRLSDLRGSGQIEQDADTVILLHSEAKSGTRTIDVLIEKNRNGPTAEMMMIYDPTRMRFEEHSPI